MNRPPRVTRTLGGGALALALAAGCAAEEPEDATPDTDAPGTTAAPADGGAATTAATPDEEVATQSTDPTVASADGSFSVDLPEGWRDVSAQVSQEIELAIRDDDMRQGFFTNLVVAGEEPIEDLEQSVADSAADIAGEEGEYELLDPVTVAGVAAPGYVVRRMSGGMEVAQTQYWVQRDDSLYVITFSAAAGAEEQTRPLLEEVLGTWTWQD